MLAILTHMCQRAWLGWLMPVSQAQSCAPSNADAHASWKCPARARAAASSAARGDSRIRPSAAASSGADSVLNGHPNASPCSSGGRSSYGGLLNQTAS